VTGYQVNGEPGGAEAAVRPVLTGRTVTLRLGRPGDAGWAGGSGAGTAALSGGRARGERARPPEFVAGNCRRPPWAGPA
jgi:hypothetical protein